MWKIGDADMEANPEENVEKRAKSLDQVFAECYEAINTGKHLGTFEEMIRMLDEDDY